MLEQFSTFLPFILIIAVFYFLMIRPENKRKKQLTQMRNEVSVGDRIITIGGVIGIVVSAKEDSLVIETGADRVRVEIMRWAISTKTAQVVEEQK
jgi:preprotein translocase subunit YajC